MRKILLAIFLFANTMVCFSQLSFGPKAGINYFNDHLDDASTYRLGPTFGGFVDYSSGHVGVVTELNYSSKGCKSDSSSTALNYLDVPIMMQLLIDMSTGQAGGYHRVNDNAAILSLVQFGVQFSFLLSAKTTNTSKSITITDKSYYTGTDIQIPLGVVYQYHSFLLGLRGILSFHNILTSDPY